MGAEWLLVILSVSGNIFYNVWYYQIIKYLETMKIRLNRRKKIILY